jgi:thiamine pyrophosphokinase
VIVLKGGDLDLSRCTGWLSGSDLLIAADGAGRLLIHLGFSPVIVGDLDSFRQESMDAAEVIHRPDQDASDAEKALALALDRGARKAVILGLEGNRLDHVLASLGALARSPLEACLVLRRGRAQFVRPGESRQWPWADGRRFSAIPIGAARGVEIKGAEWPVAEADMDWSGFLSLSNRARGSLCASVASGSLLVIIEADPDDPEAPIWD